MLYLTAEDYTNMSYYNLCGISYRSQHSNISNGKKGGGGLIQKSQVCKTPIVKKERNTYLTLNRCPLNNYE